MDKSIQTASAMDSVESVASLLDKHKYIADIGLCTSLFLALKMGKAIFLEGEPGAGKTEVAQTLVEQIETA